MMTVVRSSTKKVAIPFSYRIFIWSLYWIEIIGRFFNLKLRKRYLGLHNWKKDLIEIKRIAANRRIVWCHCSSLGEYEQAIPLLQYIRKRDNHIFILVSFYSASGYENAVKTQFLDHKIYLPTDLRVQATDFVSVLRPDLVLWTKYDFWFHYLCAVLKKDIPLIIYSASFRAEQYFFKNYGRPYLTLLKLSSKIFVQDEVSQELLISEQFRNIQISGDTRIDRVLERKLDCICDNKIRNFMTAKRTLLLASTHLEDFSVIQAFLQFRNMFNIIIFPHDVDSHNIDQLQKLMEEKVSLWSEGITTNSDVLIIDSIGKLFASYQYAHIAYVGGGFGKSIHNILEPTVFGIPTIIGPAFEKFKEARELNAQSLITVIENASQVKSCITELSNQDYSNIQQRLASYYEIHKGAARQVGDYVMLRLKENGED